MISRSLRTFWAVRPPTSVIESLTGFATELKEVCGKLGMKVAWLQPQSMHITLKFIGSIAESALPAMLDRVRRGLAESALQAADTRLQIGGLGAFPDERKPRILFANVVGERAALDRLSSLQQSLEGWLAELGLPREERPFHPHLTLGRVRDAGHRQRHPLKDQASLFQPHGARLLGEPFPIEEVILYESRPGSQEATYVPLHTLPLDGQPKENVGHGN